MKAFKILIAVVLLLVVAVVGIVFYGAFNLDSIIKQSIEQHGSKVAGVKVSLNEVKVDLSKGRIELHGLDIANPAGYKQPHAFSLGKIALQVNPDSLAKRPIVIDEIIIDQPSIAVEEKNLSTTNLSELAANIKARTAESSKADKQSEQQTKDQEPLIAVTLFSFNKASLAFTSERFGNKTFEVPSFTARKIGGDSGLSPDQLAAALMGELVNQVSESMKRGLGDLVKKQISNQTEKLIEGNLSEKDQEKLRAVKSLLAP